MLKDNSKIGRRIHQVLSLKREVVNLIKLSCRVHDLQLGNYNQISTARVISRTPRNIRLFITNGGIQQNFHKAGGKSKLWPWEKSISEAGLKGKEETTVGGSSEEAFQV